MFFNLMFCHNFNCEFVDLQFKLDKKMKISFNTGEVSLLEIC